MSRLILGHSLQTVMPSLAQSVLAALTDLFTFKLARKLLSERAAYITVRLLGCMLVLDVLLTLCRCPTSLSLCFYPSTPFTPRHERCPTRPRLP